MLSGNCGGFTFYRQEGERWFMGTKTLAFTLTQWKSTVNISLTVNTDGYKDREVQGNKVYVYSCLLECVCVCACMHVYTYTKYVSEHGVFIYFIVCIQPSEELFHLVTQVLCSP